MERLTPDRVCGLALVFDEEFFCGGFDPAGSRGMQSDRACNYTSLSMWWAVPSSPDTSISDQLLSGLEETMTKAFKAEALQLERTHLTSNTRSSRSTIISHDLCSM